jgi:hypothetical protein
MLKGLDKRMRNFEGIDCERIADASAFQSVRHRLGKRVNKLTKIVV